MARVYVVCSELNPPEDVGLDCSDMPSMTQQEFKDECDINKIMARYQKTGVLPEGIGVGAYGDFSEGVDFQQAQEILARASEQFGSLPADVRARFENDPAKFLDFVHDEKNLEEAYELGLLTEEYRKKHPEQIAPVVPAPIVEPVKK